MWRFRIYQKLCRHNKKEQAKPALNTNVHKKRMFITVKSVMNIKHGRDDRIRTCGLCVPNAALYQTEPHLDIKLKGNKSPFLKTRTPACGVLVFLLVRVTGLEPVRRGHTPLKRACLPIPAHSQIKPMYYIISGALCQE